MPGRSGRRHWLGRLSRHDATTTMTNLECEGDQHRQSHRTQEVVRLRQHRVPPGSLCSNQQYGSAGHRHCDPEDRRSHRGGEPRQNQAEYQPQHRGDARQNGQTPQLGVLVTPQMGTEGLPERRISGRERRHTLNPRCPQHLRPHRRSESPIRALGNYRRSSPPHSRSKVYRPQQPAGRRKAPYRLRSTSGRADVR